MGHTGKDKVRGGRPRLEIVLRADSIGSLEAVTAAILELTSRFDIGIIHSGVGDVSKSDVLFAETGSRLIVGFQVDVLPGLEKILREHRVETRLYKVIYTLTEDIRSIAESMVAPDAKETVLGSAKVIALFKSSRRGIIAGCEVQEGHLAVGERFRIISAMGPVYVGTIESLHIGPQAVQRAQRGQQVGLKIRDFNRVKIGDLVESFSTLLMKTSSWEPRGEVIKK